MGNFVVAGTSTDLDAILGDLCALEMQLTSAQSELDTRIRTTNSATDSVSIQAAKATPVTVPTNTVPPPVRTKPPPRPPPSRPPQQQQVVGAGASGEDWDDVINSQLQGALDALTDLSVVDEDHDTHDDVMNTRVAPAQQHPARSAEHVVTSQRKTSVPMSSLLTPPRSIVESSAQSVAPVMGDLSPLSNLDLDSAYGDSLSLPSSESHASVTTLAQQNHVTSSHAPATAASSESDPANLSQVQRCFYQSLSLSSI